MHPGALFFLLLQNFLPRPPLPRPSGLFLTALIVKREGVSKCVRRPRESQKSHRPPFRRRARRARGRRSVKKTVVFDIYCQKYRESAAAARRNKYGRSFNKSRTCSDESGTCCTAPRPRFSSPRSLNFLTKQHLPGGARRRIFPQETSKKSADLVLTNVNTAAKSLNLSKMRVKKCFFLSHSV